MSTPGPSTTENVTPDLRPSPLVSMVYGQPFFQTDAEVAALAFAADGSLWAVDEAGIVWHWQINGRLLDRGYLSDLETVWEFAPQGRRLASGSQDLSVWDPVEHDLIFREEDLGWITALGWSPDGILLASGHDNGQVVLWDPAAGKRLGELQAQPEAISALAFSPDGQYLATAGEDRSIHIWDVGSHQLLLTLPGHTDRIASLAWSFDTMYLASAGWDTSVRVWKLDQSDPIMLLNTHDDQVMQLAFAPNSPLLASADSGLMVRLWPEPAAGTIGPEIPAHDDEIRKLAFSLDGKILATGSADRSIRLWGIPEGQPHVQPMISERMQLAVFTRNGQAMIAAAQGGPVRIWQAENGSPHELDGQSEPAQAVAVDPSGRFLASGGDGLQIAIADLDQPQLPAKILEATHVPIGPLAYSFDGKRLAHASLSDGLVWIWNPETGEPELILIEAADGCTLEALAFHPDGNRIAVGGLDILSTGERDGAVCIWDIQAKDKLLQFDSGVSGLAFDRVGDMLAGAGFNGRVWLWDLTDESKPPQELPGHPERALAVTFTPDGNYLISSGLDGTIRVWDVLSGRELVAREFQQPAWALTLSPNGQDLFTANANSTCSRIPMQKLLES